MKKVLSFSSISLNILFYIKLLINYENENKDHLLKNAKLQKIHSIEKNFNKIISYTYDKSDASNLIKEIEKLSFDYFTVYSIDENFTYTKKNNSGKKNNSEYSNYIRFNSKLNDIIEFSKDNKTLGYIKITSSSWVFNNVDIINSSGYSNILVILLLLGYNLLEIYIIITDLYKKCYKKIFKNLNKIKLFIGPIYDNKKIKEFFFKIIKHSFIYYKFKKSSLVEFYDNFEDIKIINLISLNTNFNYLGRGKKFYLTLALIEKNQKNNITIKENISSRIIFCTNQSKNINLEGIYDADKFRWFNTNKIFYEDIKLIDIMMSSISKASLNNPHKIQEFENQLFYDPEILYLTNSCSYLLNFLKNKDSEIEFEIFLLGGILNVDDKIVKGIYSIFNSIKNYNSLIPIFYSYIFTKILFENTRKIDFIPDELEYYSDDFDINYIDKNMIYILDNIYFNKILYENQDYLFDLNLYNINSDIKKTEYISNLAWMNIFFNLN